MTAGPDATPADDAAGASVIRLSIPAELRFLRIARLTAAGIAGDLGFGLQDVEDLRVAVDEMCAALIEDAGPWDRLRDRLPHRRRPPRDRGPV